MAMSVPQSPGVVLDGYSSKRRIARVRDLTAQLVAEDDAGQRPARRRNLDERGLRRRGRGQERRRDHCQKGHPGPG